MLKPSNPNFALFFTYCKCSSLILGIISYGSQRSLLEKEAKNALNAGSLNIVNETYNYLNERNQ